MPHLNAEYSKLKPSYLFSDIAHKVASYKAAHPDVDVIRLGIGDVTRPLGPTVVVAMQEACAEQGEAATFHGYGPEQGYDFLRAAVAEYYANRGTHSVTVDPADIFISDGAKSDTGNITELFAANNLVLIPDPVYPVYVDSNVMAGRSITYIDATADNGFLPLPDYNRHADIIYICSPNNPTGAAYGREALTEWVRYALDNDSIILYDAAYERFITDDLPRSIYEIEGAVKCAIEFCSLSKTAGFTGTRCGYTVVPSDLQFGGQSLNAMWLRRQTTKFNGVSYIVQRGAAAALSAAGQAECLANIDYYRCNARIIMERLGKCGIRYYGGVNSPYIWFECPHGMDSWTFFDYMLDRIGVVGTPGEGFGANGRHYFRLTSFGTTESTEEAMDRFERLL